MLRRHYSVTYIGVTAFHILERQNQNWHDDWLTLGNILRQLEGNRSGLAAWCFDSRIL